MDLIATTDGNWDYYVRTFEDGSKCVVYIAKEGSGAGSGYYCNVKRLRAHFIHLANLIHGKDWHSMIPNDWNVKDQRFFDELGIH